MKKIPFDIKYRPQIESGEYKVQTTDGRNVRIICWDKKVYGGRIDIVALVPAESTGTECIQVYNPDGTPQSCGTNNKFKLFLLTNEPELTEFEESLRQVIVKSLSGEAPNGSGGTMSWAVYLSDDDVRKLAPKILELAKKELLSYADESNPAIEAMADLERTYFCNPDKLPKWLKDDIAKKELNAHTKGYNKGYKDAEKQYNESVAYHFPIMPTPPSGWGCDGTHCTNPQMDCINCPRKTTGGMFNTQSGTSTLKAEG